MLDQIFLCLIIYLDIKTPPIFLEFSNSSFFLRDRRTFQIGERLFEIRERLFEVGERLLEIRESLFEIRDVGMLT